MTEKPTPKYIYKYQPFDKHSCINLIRHQLYFSKPMNLNDPFDFNPRFKITDKTKDNIRVFFILIKKGVQDRLGDKFNEQEFDRMYLTDGKPNERFEEFFINQSNQGIDEVINIYRDQIGVTCFSEIKDEILMWSHYSNGHQGFCLEFETKYSPFKMDTFTLIPVDYVNSYPSISLGEIKRGPVKLMKTLVRTKWEGWKYEKEWRLICWGGNLAYPYDTSSLSSIYLGYKMPDDDAITIRQLTANLPPREDGSKRCIYQMHQSKTEFKVEPEELSLINNAHAR